MSSWDLSESDALSPLALVRWLSASASGGKTTKCLSSMHPWPRMDQACQLAVLSNRVEGGGIGETGERSSRDLMCALCRSGKRPTIRSIHFSLFSDVRPHFDDEKERSEMASEVSSTCNATASCQVVNCHWL